MKAKPSFRPELEELGSRILNELLPNDRDIVAAAEHDEIYFEADLGLVPQ